VTACLLNLTDPTVPISSTLLEELSKDDSVLSEELSREPLTRSRVFLDLEDVTRRAVADNDAAAVQHALLTASELAASAPDGKTFVARILWKSAIDAEAALADLILDSPNSPCDFKFIDDINGRTCMHEAATAGALRLIDICITKGVEVNRRDQYGRTALHYAVIGGHVDCVDRLIASNADPSIRDMDNFSCHYYAVVYGHLDCVRILLKVGTVGADTNARDDEINLLALACLYGHVDIVLLLLQQGARQLPNSNGEYPIHLAAGAGHAEVCRLLTIRAKETMDIPDKFNEWTPLFHAARNGRAAVVKVLLDAGSNSQAADELGRIPIFYAGWYGHVECVNMLLYTAQQQKSAVKGAPPESAQSPQADRELRDIENDTIPSLFLPPPIMPFRIYGHNYLDKQYLVQITLGLPYSQFNPSKPDPPVKITAWTTDYPIGTPNPRPQSLMKMVMTSRSDHSAIPVSLTVPLSESRDVVTFRVQDLSELSLEFSFYPKFGSKAIGRAAVLASAFEDLKDSKPFSLAILDHRLHIIGQVIFEACIIRPFDGVTLQFGGAVETYWKSSSQYMDRGGPSSVASNALDSNQTSPSTHSAVMKPSGSMTISSLSNDFIIAVVQGTRDYIPVVYSEWKIPIDGLDIGVSDVTASQFESIAAQKGRGLSPTALGSTSSPHQWAQLTRSVMVPLEKLLTVSKTALATQCYLTQFLIEFTGGYCRPASRGVPQQGHPRLEWSGPLPRFKFLCGVNFVGHISDRCFSLATPDFFCLFLTLRLHRVELETTKLQVVFKISYVSHVIRVIRSRLFCFALRSARTGALQVATTATRTRNRQTMHKCFCSC
jgi:CDK inhibitor PHO81